MRVCHHNRSKLPLPNCTLFPFFFFVYKSFFCSPVHFLPSSPTMNLPIEIWLKVASQLPMKDRAASVLVSKSWSQIFISQLYETIDLRPTQRNQKELLVTEGDGDTPGKPKVLSMVLIQKYGHFIRELKLYTSGPYIRDIPPSLNALSRLHLELSPKERTICMTTPWTHKGSRACWPPIHRFNTSS